jgi:hypothetical protein
MEVQKIVPYVVEIPVEIIANPESDHEERDSIIMQTRMP